MHCCSLNRYDGYVLAFKGTFPEFLHDGNTMIDFSALNSDAFH